MNNKNFIEKTLDFAKTVTTHVGRKIVVYNEITSTNDKAKELAQTGADEGTIVIARTQEKGRGRFDRVWYSPIGGIYLSVIVKPQIPAEKTTLLSLIGALAVAKTITSNYNLRAMIKWPNDVRIKGKKVAGILLESEIDRNQIRYVILGIGINLNIDVNRFPRTLKHAATSLSQEFERPVDYHQFLGDLLSRLDSYYTMVINEEFETILREWKERSDTLGRKIRVVTLTEEIMGEACDVDESGFLVVHTEADEYRTITAGDCLYCDER